MYEVLCSPVTAYNTIIFGCAIVIAMFLVVEEGL